MVDADRRTARELAQRSLARGDPLGWFEQLYRLVGDDWRAISWANLEANPHLLEWVEKGGVVGEGRRALVIGCGLGDDAEAVARRGFSVIAFDVALTAIEGCRRRFADSPVQYLVADLFSPPGEWEAAFDLVVEVYTLQVLPPELRRSAMERMAGFVAPSGTLLAVARGREPEEDPGKMPWPLTREELACFRKLGLREVVFQDFMDQEDPPVRRFLAEYRREP